MKSENNTRIKDINPESKPDAIPYKVKFRKNPTNV
jgi:hypothetical protein